jgi:hypothetical protein
MIAHASQFKTVRFRSMPTRVRYAAPDDLLPWADPYIASLFAEEDSQAEIGTVLDEEEPSGRR